MSTFFPTTFAHWVHDLSPFLIRFSENLGVRYYGLAYLVGFLGAAALLRLYYKKGRSPFGADTVTDLMTYVVAGVLIGGRLGYFLLYQAHSVTADPLILFRVWEGGMSSHGGMAGVLVGLLWYAHRRRIPFFYLSDLIVTTAPLGLFFGRIANFINGELWGKPSSVPWAVIFSNTGGGPQPRHPSQLYEAGLEGLLLLLFMQWRFWRSDAGQKQPGRLSGEFLVAYALVRACGEVFREPDFGVSPILGLSRGTFYSLFMIVAGSWLIAKRNPPPSSR